MEERQYGSSICLQDAALPNFPLLSSFRRYIIIVIVDGRGGSVTKLGSCFAVAGRRQCVFRRTVRDTDGHDRMSEQHSNFHFSSHSPFRSYYHSARGWMDLLWPNVRGGPQLLTVVLVSCCCCWDTDEKEWMMVNPKNGLVERNTGTESWRRVNYMRQIIFSELSRRRLKATNAFPVPHTAIKIERMAPPHLLIVVLYWRARYSTHLWERRRRCERVCNRNLIDFQPARRFCPHGKRKGGPCGRVEQIGRLSDRKKWILQGIFDNFSILLHILDNYL